MDLNKASAIVNPKDILYYMQYGIIRCIKVIRGARYPF